MESILSFCGLICAGCPISWSTNEKDEKLKNKMKVEIAKMSNTLYKTNHTSKDITDCDGCLGENGNLFPGCVNCQIRNCARTKKIENCAHCSDYPCETISKFFVENPESKIRLEFVKSLL
jgi:hypothetical protein